MNMVRFLYLSQKDVVDVGLTMKEAILAAEDCLKEHGLKHYENPPKPGVHPRKEAFIHAMPGYLPRKEACGMKWVSGFPKNSAYDLPTIMGLIVLNDVNTGQPTAVLDCAYITALRTAAVSGVSAKHLANKDAKTLGIVGAGIQGRYNLLSLQEVLTKLEVVRVFDTNEKILQQFTSLMSEHVSFKIEACKSCRQVIEGADVVVTATGHLEERIFQSRWVKEGALVLPVHTRGWETATIHNADKFVVDDWQQLSHTLFRADGYYGQLPGSPVELGEIVIGSKPGREGRNERIVNINYGMALHDVYLATLILSKARARGLGQTLTLTEAAIPFA
ncbi:MAG: ornithine cyclodeaminase family protein [Desulfobacterales bacterium]|nr:MAG: ornithine cyclodeaminase family protein [Desulfobacterales bacterium]